MNKKKRSPGLVALDIVIGILCLALVGAAGFALDMWQESFGWEYDEDSFYYRLSDGDYGAMVEMYHYNEANNVKPDKSLRQYYAVAEYFEAASWYKVYSQSGDMHRAAGYEEAMARAEKEMGALYMVAGDICRQLNIAE